MKEFGLFRKLQLFYPVKVCHLWTIQMLYLINLQMQLSPVKLSQFNITPHQQLQEPLLSHVVKTRNQNQNNYHRRWMRRLRLLCKVLSNKVQMYTYGLISFIKVFFRNPYSFTAFPYMTEHFFFQNDRNKLDPKFGNSISD